MFHKNVLTTYVACKVDIIVVTAKHSKIFPKLITVFKNYQMSDAKINKNLTWARIKVFIRLCCAIWDTFAFSNYASRLLNLITNVSDNAIMQCTFAEEKNESPEELGSTPSSRSCRATHVDSDLRAHAVGKQEKRSKSVWNKVIVIKGFCLFISCNQDNSDRRELITMRKWLWGQTEVSRWILQESWKNRAIWRQS